MGIEVKALHSGSERVLMNVAAEVFDNPVDPDLTKEFLADPRHHIVVAIDEGLVVGFASGVDYIHPDKAPELWINEVGVAPTHRRRGLGRALLQALFEEGKDRNCSAAWVLTERRKAEAVALYSSVGGTEAGAGDLGHGDEVVGFSFDLLRNRGTAAG